MTVSKEKRASIGLLYYVWHFIAPGSEHNFSSLNNINYPCWCWIDFKLINKLLRVYLCGIYSWKTTLTLRNKCSLLFSLHFRGRLHIKLGLVIYATITLWKDNGRSLWKILFYMCERISARIKGTYYLRRRIPVIYGDINAGHCFIHAMSC